MYNGKIRGPKNASLDSLGVVVFFFTPCSVCVCVSVGLVLVVRVHGGFFVFWLLCTKSYSILQGLAADKVGPPADFGGDALLPGELLAHALGEEDGSLGGGC